MQQINVIVTPKAKPTISVEINGVAMSVVNSDGSYSTTHYSGTPFIIPNITVTDSDGSTYSYPSVKDVTCTPPVGADVENSDGSYTQHVNNGATLVLPDTEIKNTAGTTILTQPSGTRTGVIADSVVTNSDNTFSLNVPAETNLELPDVTHKDIYGDNVIKPAVITYDASAGFWNDIVNIDRDISTLNKSLIYTTYDDSAITRKTPQSISYTGTTYYVDASKVDDSGNGLTPATAKKTIMAAYGIATDGCVLQLADGTYDLSIEPLGYCRFDSINKGVLINGNSLNNSAVILTGGTTYAFVIRNCGKMKFKHLTINTSGSSVPIYSIYGATYGNTLQSFDNCIFNHYGTGRFYMHTGMNLTDTKQYDIEFISCTIDLTTTNETLNIQNASNTFNVLFSKCVISRENNIAIKQDSSLSNLYIYDSEFTMKSNHVAIRCGKDTEVPIYTFSLFDIRGNSIQYNTGLYQHAILIGRGVTTGMVINNYISMDSNASNLAIGLVVKSACLNLGDFIIYNNYINAPRPIYIKGGANNDIKGNVGICNTTGFAGFEYVNYIDGSTDILSTGNNIENNTFIGIDNGLIVYNGGTSEDESVTIKTCTFANNRYYFSTNYATIAGVSYTWVNRNNFWGGVNEIGSAQIEMYSILIKLIE